MAPVKSTATYAMIALAARVDAIDTTSTASSSSLTATRSSSSISFTTVFDFVDVTISECTTSTSDTITTTSTTALTSTIAAASTSTSSDSTSTATSVLSASSISIFTVTSPLTITSTAETSQSISPAATFSSSTITTTTTTPTVSLITSLAISPRASSTQFGTDSTSTDLSTSDVFSPGSASSIDSSIISSATDNTPSSMTVMSKFLTSLLSSASLGTIDVSSNTPGITSTMTSLQTVAVATTAVRSSDSTIFTSTTSITTPSISNSNSETASPRTDTKTTESPNSFTSSTHSIPNTSNFSPSSTSTASVPEDAESSTTDGVVTSTLTGPASSPTSISLFSSFASSISISTVISPAKLVSSSSRSPSGLLSTFTTSRVTGTLTDISTSDSVMPVIATTGIATTGTATTSGAKNDTIITRSTIVANSQTSSGAANSTTSLSTDVALSSSSITISTVTTTVSTINSISPTSTPQPFAIQPQLGSSRKRQTATFYIGFSGRNAILVSNAEDAYGFAITPGGALVIYSNVFLVGTTVAAGFQILRFFTPDENGPAQTRGWTRQNGVLTQPGATFCVSNGSQLYLYYGSKPNDCIALVMQTSDDPSDFNLSNGASMNVTITSSVFSISLSADNTAIITTTASATTIALATTTASSATSCRTSLSSIVDASITFTGSPYVVMSLPGVQIQSTPLSSFMLEDAASASTKNPASMSQASSTLPMGSIYEVKAYISATESCNESAMSSDSTLVPYYQDNFGSGSYSGTDTINWEEESSPANAEESGNYANTSLAQNASSITDSISNPTNDADSVAHTAISSAVLDDGISSGNANSDFLADAHSFDAEEQSTATTFIIPSVTNADLAVNTPGSDKDAAAFPSNTLSATKEAVFSTTSDNSITGVSTTTSSPSTELPVKIPIEEPSSTDLIFSAPTSAEETPTTTPVFKGSCFRIQICPMIVKYAIVITSLILTMHLSDV